MCMHRNDEPRLAAVPDFSFRTERLKSLAQEYQDALSDDHYIAVLAMPWVAVEEGENPNNKQLSLHSNAHAALIELAEQVRKDYGWWPYALHNLDSDSWREPILVTTTVNCEATTDDGHFLGSTRDNMPVIALSHDDPRFDTGPVVD